MARPRFEDIKARLDACKREDPPDREKFLEETCADDPELRAQANWLYEQRFGARRPALAKFGPYELEREIGRGGMGVVYLAARADDQFERRVAIKLLHPGADSGGLIERFRNERQILAHLDHPNICRLFDGGVTELGEPYLVMEYVRGALPIDEYCDQQRLTVRERVRLFLQVCDAVQHAHRLLIVHRDLKPDNILVSSEGHVKLMDFGLAKNLFEPLAVRRMMLQTLDGSQPMTPAYASPEQVQGGPIGTSTDVYSLGVILYELLSGTHPFDRHDRGNLQTLLEAIRSEEPEAPSARLLERGRHPSPELERIAEQRRAESTRTLARELRGDLDAILLTALRKDPERRYGSVSLLRDDLQRYLDGAAVRARPDSWGYRTGKLIRRHLALAAAAFLVLAMSLGFAVTMAFQARRLAVERDSAEQVAALLVSLFRASDPDEDRAGGATARDALDRAEEKLGTLDQSPEVQSRLLLALGSAYRGLGELQRAKALVVRGLHLRRKAFGDASLPAAEAYQLLAEVGYDLSEYQEAERSARRALEIRRRHLKPDDDRIADGLNTLGMVLDRRGAYAEAEQVLQQAIGLRQQHRGGQHEYTLRAYSNLGLIYLHRGEYTKARTVFERVLEQRRQALGPRHHRVALTLNRLGQIANASGDLDHAGQLFTEALSIEQEKLRPGHPRIAETLSNLASLLQDQGKYERAGELYQAALDIQVQNAGLEHAQAAVTLNNLATLLEDQGRYEEAVRMHRQSLAVRQKVYGPEHAATARSMHNLARALGRAGGRYEAEDLAQRALSIRIAQFGPRHAETAASWHGLGALAEWRGELNEAQHWFGKALAARRELGLPLPTADSAAALGSLLLRTGRVQEAEPLLREALEIRTQRLRGDHRQVAEAESLLGECLMRQKRYADAMGLLTRSDAVLRRQPVTPEIRAALERLPELRRRFR